MPPKDLDYTPLYIADLGTDETYLIGHIENIETSSSEHQDDEKYIKLNESSTFSATIRRSAVYQLYIRIGHKYRVPNNWLKMHHISMNRKGGYR